MIVFPGGEVKGPKDDAHDEEGISRGAGTHSGNLDDPTNLREG